LSAPRQVNRHWSRCISPWLPLVLLPWFYFDHNIQNQGASGICNCGQNVPPLEAIKFTLPS
jgi:hypothetical protein